MAESTSVKYGSATDLLPCTIADHSLCDELTTIVANPPCIGGCFLMISCSCMAASDGSGRAHSSSASGSQSDSHGDELYSRRGRQDENSHARNRPRIEQASSRTHMLHCSEMQAGHDWPEQGPSAQPCCEYGSPSSGSRRCSWHLENASNQSLVMLFRLGTSRCKHHPSAGRCSKDLEWQMKRCITATDCCIQHHWPQAHVLSISSWSRLAWISFDSQHFFWGCLNFWHVTHETWIHLALLRCDHAGSCKSPLPHASASRWQVPSTTLLPLLARVGFTVGHTLLSPSAVFCHV